MARDGHLTTTTSICRTCARLIPAHVEITEGAVWFDKHCPQHGRQRVRVYSNADEYLDLGRYHRVASTPLQFASAADQPCPDACGVCPRHEQHTCVPILEITDHCDLACPVCLANNRGSYRLTRSQVADILDRLIAAEGQIAVLNLAGGEPTLNPDFRPIVEECLRRREILRVSVSTNGLRLEKDPELLRFLAERNVVISLQFDGTDDDAYLPLRGRRLLQSKLRIIEAAGALDAPMSLTATIARGVNEQQVRVVADLLFRHDHILSAMFQPMAYVGRGASVERPVDPVGIPEITRGLDGAADGQIERADFSPLPCSHPACFSLAFYLRVGEGRFTSIKRLVPIDRYLDMLQNRALFGTDPASFDVVRAAVYDLWSSPAALTPDSQQALSAVRCLLRSIGASPDAQPGRALAAAERSIKSIFIHHFMDRGSFDLSRARKCCNVYPQPDGRMIPVCVYNCLRR
jgi:7,8-dihydro-6-hydroxymethylpterin dimethyltransferase